MGPPADDRVADQRPRSPVPMEIRGASADDRDWAAALLARSDPWVRLGATYPQCLHVCRDPRYEVSVARVDGERCGVVILQDKGLAGSPYLKSIAVAEPFRERGLGGALMDFAEARFREESRWFFLCVSSFNARARSFYERRGYVAVGEFPDHVLDGASEIVMRKRLG
ncbi:MAG: GNAT family N-acetyltransferase [Longimicrobiales bacterium]|nr:GNAT family N-acetyltransferase [Longimicrobiales bacterium]